MTRGRPWTAVTTSVCAAAGLASGLWLTAACASRPTGTSSRGATGVVTTGAAPLPQITVQRSGGFAGLSETVVLDSHGAWTVTSQAGGRTTGQLTADQITPIRALAADGELAREAHRPPATTTRCSDAFHYTLTVEAVQVGYTDCAADAGRPTAAIALVDRVLQLTKSKLE